MAVWTVQGRRRKSCQAKETTLLRGRRAAAADGRKTEEFLGNNAPASSSEKGRKNYRGGENGIFIGSRTKREFSPSAANLTLRIIIAHSRPFRSFSFSAHCCQQLWMERGAFGTPGRRHLAAIPVPFFSLFPRPNSNARPLQSWSGILHCFGLKRFFLMA